MLIATVFAADNDVGVAGGALGCTIACLLTRGLFFSTVVAGVASSSGGGVSSTAGVGLGFGVSAEISTLGFELGLSALGVGVAAVLFELFERSGRVAGTNSWARANGDPVSATPMHRTNWTVPFWRRTDETLSRLRVRSNNRLV